MAKNESIGNGTPSTPSSVGTDPSAAEILEGLKKYFAGDGSMNSIADNLGIRPALFRSRLRAAYVSGAIVLKLPRSTGLARVLADTWPSVIYHVLNAEGDHFFPGSAEVFFEEISTLLRQRVERSYLRIGVVSGRTSGKMIESICNIDKSWYDLMPCDLLPPKIFIYALNVSQIDGYRHLAGNANILAYQLAHSFSTKVKNCQVEAYGLSATLLQTKEEVQRTDCAKETRVVLRQTDPKRLAASLAAQDKSTDEILPTESQLDIVITGVGSIHDSLFRVYCGTEFNIDKLQKEELVVGDIAYCPVTRMGEPRVLRDENDAEWEFYRAISLEVLREMSSNPNKRVIVVARSERDNNDENRGRKTDIIHAAIAAKLCNVVITDSFTADDLRKRLSPVGD
jgi:hypothetical protein